MIDFAKRRRILDYLDKQVSGCFWCALSYGDPYATAYCVVENPNYYADKEVRELQEKQRKEGRRTWHDIKRVKKDDGTYYDRFECYKGSGASGPVTEDRMCFSCKESIDT